MRSGIEQGLHSGQLLSLQQLQRCSSSGRKPVHLVSEPELAAAPRPSRRRRPRWSRRRGDRLGDGAGAGRERAPARRRPSARSRARCRRRRSPRRRPAAVAGRCRGPSSRRAPRRRRSRGARCRRRSSCRGRGRPAGSARSRSSLARSSASAASFTPSSSTSESPVGMPWARKKLKHIAPPIRIWSATSRKRSMTPILSETLAPPRTTTSGRCGRLDHARSARSPRARAAGRRSRAGGAATPSVLAWARWAAPKASLT